MNYEGLSITKVKSLSDLYEHPIGKTVILITDEHAHARPVLFDGPVLGGQHFLEARNRAGRLEIISSVLRWKDLGIATAQNVGLVDLFSKDLTAANEKAGLFDYTGGQGAFIYLSGSFGYLLIHQKVEAAGLVAWAKKNPYKEPEHFRTGDSGSNSDEAD